MSGSFEFVQWNACVHRPDLGLCSHLKEVWENGVRTHVSSRENPLYQKKFSSEEDRTHDAALSSTANPTHNQQAILAPFHMSYLDVAETLGQVSVQGRELVQRTVGGALLVTQNLGQEEWSKRHIHHNPLHTSHI